MRNVRDLKPNEVIVCSTMEDLVAVVQEINGIYKELSLRNQISLKRILFVHGITPGFFKSLGLYIADTLGAHRVLVGDFIGTFNKNAIKIDAKEFYESTAAKADRIAVENCKAKVGELVQVNIEGTTLKSDIFEVAKVFANCGEAFVDLAGAGALPVSKVKFFGEKEIIENCGFDIGDKVRFMRDIEQISSICVQPDPSQNKGYYVSIAFGHGLYVLSTSCTKLYPSFNEKGKADFVDMETVKARRAKRKEERSAVKLGSKIRKSAQKGEAAAEATHSFAEELLKELRKTFKSEQATVLTGLWLPTLGKPFNPWTNEPVTIHGFEFVVSFIFMVVDEKVDV